MDDQTTNSVIPFGGASVVILKENKVLVVAKGNPEKRKFQLVGGKAEKDETPIVTSVREVLEESKLALDPGKLEPLCRVNFKKGTETLAHHFFLYRVSEEEYEVLSDRKRIEWIPISSLRNGKLFMWWGYKIPIRATEKLLSV